MKNNNMTRNLGEGNITKLLASLAIPAVVAQVVNLLYNIVDRVYIGHIPGIGANALTGVGLFTPILMLINAFAMLAGSGGAPRAAIFMGKKDNDTAERIIGNCFTFIMICAVVLTAVFYVSAPQLLRWFGASDATLPYALSYARIYILGSVFVLIVMAMNMFITTQGFAKISMLTTVIGAVINIVLDPVFIFVFNMGVRGAAMATVLSQAVGAVWILHFLTGNKTILRLKKANLRLDAKIIGPCLALGISTFVMLSTESILSISFTSSLSRYGGDLAVGAMTIITSTNQLIVMPLQGICQGGQPIISYNYGAKKLSRVKQSYKILLCVCVIYSVVLWAIIMAFPQVFAKLFTTDAALIDFTAKALRIYCRVLFVFGIQIACQMTFVSIGNAPCSIIVAILRKFILLIPLIYILPHVMENKTNAVYMAEPVADIIAVSCTLILFLVQFRKSLRRLTE